MTTDLSKLKEDIKAEIIAEIAASKRAGSAWRKAKSNFKEKVFSAFGQNPQSWRIVDSIADISRAVFEVSSVNSFTEDDIEVIEGMLNEILDIAIKHKDAHDARTA